MDIEGVAIVIGAGGGIGREVAMALASHGARTIVCGDINLKAVQHTAEKCRSCKANQIPNIVIRAWIIDVRNEGQVQAVVLETQSEYGRIDYFVNAAGLGTSGQKPTSDMTLEEYRRMDEVHNIGSFLCISAVLSAMLKQEPRTMPVAGRPRSSSARYMSRGSIVIVTSLASEGAFKGTGNYVAAKHAVKGLVQTAAIENARRGVRINAVAPAYVSGPMMDTFLDQAPTLKPAILGDLAMGRLVDPEEVADAVIFLASASASSINGHTLVVDGGSSLQLANVPFSG